jgi:hypothetical protein
MTFPGFGVGSSCWSFFDYDDKAEEDIVVIDVNGTVDEAIRIAGL